MPDATNYLAANLADNVLHAAAAVTALVAAVLPGATEEVLDA